MKAQAPRCPNCGKAMHWYSEFTARDGSPVDQYVCEPCLAVTGLPRSVYGPALGRELPPTVVASREQRLENLRMALQRKQDELTELREEWDFGLHEITHPYLRRKINRYYEPHVAELEKIVSTLQTDYANARDELGESPEEAGKRDGCIAWLNDWLDEQEVGKDAH